MNKEYIKECNCPEIQKGWKPKDGDGFYDIHSKKLRVVCKDDIVWKLLTKREVLKSYIFLPSLIQLILMMGERFICFNKRNKKEEYWIGFTKDKKSGVGFLVEEGSTPELAAAKAYKRIKKEGKGK